MKALSPIDQYNKEMDDIYGLKCRYDNHIDALKDVAETKLKVAQEKCNPHIDNGGWCYGFCTKCGVSLG